VRLRLDDLWGCTGRDDWRGPVSLDQARRRQRGSCGLRRFALLRQGRLLAAALPNRRLGEDVACGQRDTTLASEALDELPGDHLLDRARGTPHLDPVIALQQRRHLLARGAKELRNLVDPNSCQR